MSELENLKKKIRILTDAIANKRIVIIKDYAGHSGDRIIEPVNFVSRGSSVWCFEHQSMKHKQLIINRIGGIELTDELWQYEDSHCKGETDIFRWSGSERIRLRLDMGSKAKRNLIERFPDVDYLTSSELYPLRNNVWRLDVFVTSMKPVARFYASWLDEIDIIDTPELKEEFDNYISSYSIPVKLKEDYTVRQQQAILSLLYDVMMVDKEPHVLERTFLNKYLNKFKISLYDFKYIEASESIRELKGLSSKQTVEISKVLNAMEESDYIFKDEEKLLIENIISQLKTIEGV